MKQLSTSGGPGSQVAPAVAVLAMEVAAGSFANKETVQ